MEQFLEPTVSHQVLTVPVARRLAELHGKRIGFVDNSKCNADLFIQRIAAQFADRFAVVRRAHYPQGRAERSLI